MSQPPLPLRPLDYAAMPRRPWRGRLFFTVSLLVAIGLILLMMLRGTRSSGVSYIPISLSDFYAEMNRGSISEVRLDGDEVTGFFSVPISRGGRSISFFRTSLPAGTAGNWEFMQWLLRHGGVTVDVEASNSLVTNFVLPFIPWLIIFFFIWFFVFRQLRARSAPGTPMPVIVVNPEAR